MRNIQYFLTGFVFFVVLFSINSASGFYQGQPQDQFLPEVPGVQVESWVESLEIPWSLVFLPDGRALVSERPGRIRMVENGSLRAEAYATLEVAHIGEGGLMGLALHPQFPDVPFIYAMHTFQRSNGVENRVVRLLHEGDHGVFDTVIIDGIPGGRAHNGGRIAFGPDGMLYVTTGEIFQGHLAQDLSSLGGKILRITPEGGIPEDNPFSESPVYSYGHRNPQGLVFHPETGSLFSSEHGPSGEQGWYGHDEINIIVPGGNYGWPEVIGAPGDERFVDPLVFWEPATPPSGMTFWNRDLLIATLRSQALVRIVVETGDGTYQVQEIERWFADGDFSGRFGRLRDAVTGPDGSLYVLTSNRDGRGSPREGDDRILRITRK